MPPEASTCAAKHTRDLPDTHSGQRNHPFQSHVIRALRMLTAEGSPFGLGWNRPEAAVPRSRPQSA